MPGTSTIEINCEKCKKSYEAEAIEHIDLSEDRDLIKNLKAGKPNRVQCPKCKKVMYLDRSVVINFEPQNLIVLYDPKARSATRKDELRKDYQSIIAFNEILTDLAEETEFKVVSSVSELKVLITEYVKTYM
ncbi:MAG: CpXC domain-containing protein [Candidatus Thorarchaeota archaeon]